MIKSTMDYDKWGHCVFCHKCMLIEQVIDQEVQTRFTPDYDEVQVLLNTGSKMRIAICKSCKDKEEYKDYDTIMKIVKRGWEVESDVLVKDEKNKKWTKEKQKEYLERRAKLSIIDVADDKPDYALEAKVKEHKENYKIKKQRNK